MENPQDNLNLQNNSVKKCPVSIINSKISNLNSRPFSITSKINYLGMRYLGRFWILQYFGSSYPGVLAHFSRGKLIDKLWWGQKRQFHRTTVLEGKSASTYFLESGINKFAKQNGGICTFRMGFTLAIYQNTNVAIIKDEWLAPSTDQNKNLFGNFMGTLPIESKIRKSKRAAIESTLGSMSFMKSIEGEIIYNIELLLNKYDGSPLSLEKFCREVVADIDSLATGILDFKIKPLSYYFNSEEFSNITSEFFDIASDVISKLDKKASQKFDTISPFVKTILKDNFISINSAPDTNIIKRYFKIWKLPLTLNIIDTLPDDCLKELGTIIVAIYDTTSLSLSWAISYIEQNPMIKENIINDAKNKQDSKKLSYIDLTIFEAIRLGGSNPTALWRKVVIPFELQIGEHKIMVLPGTMMWLDRRSANQDSKLFVNPKEFNPKNIESIMNSKNENISSLLTKNRYEINSFSMINTENNPRKCPARVFSVYVQSLIIRLLYDDYTLKLKNNDTHLKNFCAMPKQSSSGIIELNKNTKEIA